LFYQEGGKYELREDYVCPVQFSLSGTSGLSRVLVITGMPGIGLPAQKVASFLGKCKSAK